MISELEQTKRLEERKVPQVEESKIVDAHENLFIDNWNKIPVPSLKESRIKTSDVTYTKGIYWDSMFINRQLKNGIYEYGFEKPSPIQEDLIPFALNGSDIIARAKNGTGKTASYLIPIIEKINRAEDYVQALIVVPTRELAFQISAVLQELSQFCKIESVVTTGGTDLRNDICRFYNPVQVIIATPGRIVDLASKNVVDLSKCNILVLDEADKLLYDEFQYIIEDIISFLPETRQIIMVSATFTEQIEPFKDKYLPKAKIIKTVDELTLKGVTQFYAYVEEAQKVHCLYALFSRLLINQTIIFCNSVFRVKCLAKAISNLGFSCYYIHSQMTQESRNKVFHGFRKGNCRCLVATDLCTRGIDVQTVNVVINFDFPKSAETYLHRIGRSGRFGHLGIAINFITDSSKSTLFRIERELSTRIHPIPSTIDPYLYTAQLI